jgi:arabinofuranan 3-O-arabinosyltransferase
MATRFRLPAYGRALPWGLAALSMALAFGQRHGRAYTDTRIELTTEPGLFLHRVTSVWSPTLDLGHVQSGQFVGYLFPMGPYFAGAHAIGVPAWIAERIWLAALLWLAGWGTVLLVDALYQRRRGAVHLVAAILYLANPYVVVQANRATASLLAYAALPWVLLAAHRGLRQPRGWRWPALIALAVAASSGGTNAATVFWVALAPAALVVYEVLVLRARRAHAIAFAWRAILLTALASAWWLVPVWIQSKQGSDFLAFTEQPRAIWSTSSMAESLRLMGYWLSYFGSGFGNLQTVSTAVRPYLTSAPVMVATFGVPLLAFGGLLLTRRWRYAPFFGLLAVLALVVMAAGYPSGKPAASTLEWIYYHVQATQFLRTTYKAGPLLAMSLACLAGAAVGQLLALRARRLREARSPLLRMAPVAFVPLAVLFGLPLFTGRVIEPSFAYGSIPAVWRTGLSDTVRATPPDRRIMVLPGQLFGAYRWGQTFDPPIAPALTRRPVLQRTVDHYADPRAVQLQEAVDDLVQQGRLVPGQLGPLLDLMGVGQVLVATDGRPDQSGESPPATIAESLRDQPGFDRVARAYGSSRRYFPLAGQGGPPVRLPDLRRYETPGSAAPGYVRLHAAQRSTILDGDGNGIAELAATTGALSDAALFYAGDLDPRAIRDMVRSGATLVFSDSNRRRRLTPSLIRGDLGPTLTAEDAIPRDVPSFDLFPGRRASEQTVAEYSDLVYLRSAAPPRSPLFPGRSPYAAFDGRIETTWYPSDPPPSCACLDLRLRRPQPIPYIEVHPRTVVTGETVPLGVKVNDRRERTVSLSASGWSRIAIGRQPLRTLRLRVTERSLLGPVGLDEVDIPGVRVRQSLRLPTWLARATQGLDLRRTSIRVGLQRTTNDFPFRPSVASAELDPETAMARQVTLPTGRRFHLSGWASPSPDAPDPAFDRLAGMPAGWQFAGSSRFEGIPARRASAAFDGDPRSAWVADYGPGRGAWLSARWPTPLALRSLHLIRGPAEYAFPDQVDVEAEGRIFRRLRPGPGGSIVLPVTVRTRSLRLDVTDVAAPSAKNARRLLDAVAVGELQVPGLRPPRPRRTGRFATSCGDLTVRSPLSTARARVFGSVEALDRGTALRLAGCGARSALDLPAGTALVTAWGATMRPYILSLDSPAPSGSVSPQSPGVVQSPGHRSDTSRTGVRLRLQRPGWLVLGEGYARGWRASCRSSDGKEHELGAPKPVDGYANGWRVGRSCSVARFWFAPQRLANISYGLSALTGIALLAFLLLPLARRRRTAPVGSPISSIPLPDSVVGLGRRTALGIGIGVGLFGAWLFAVRAGVLLGVAAAAITYLGMSSRRLLWAAIPPLVVIPLLYVLAAHSEFGGFFGYADQHLASHWLAVAAVCAVAGACVFDAWRLRRATAEQRRP